jgi:N-methylhydantoinase B/oxoprolinase/acetone carboxylase alpha subunit
MAGRTEFAPAGLLGGKPGALRKLAINGVEVHPKGRYVLAPGDRLVSQEAGGGGFGDPVHRDRTRLRRDLDEGYVTVEGLRTGYGLMPADLPARGRDD